MLPDGGTRGADAGDDCLIASTDCRLAQEVGYRLGDGLMRRTASHCLVTACGARHEYEWHAQSAHCRLSRSTGSEDVRADPMAELCSDIVAIPGEYPRRRCSDSEGGGQYEPPKRCPTLKHPLQTCNAPASSQQPSSGRQRQGQQGDGSQQQQADSPGQGRQLAKILTASNVSAMVQRHHQRLQYCEW